MAIQGHTHTHTHTHSCISLKQQIKAQPPVFVGRLAAQVKWTERVSDVSEKHPQE